MGGEVTIAVRLPDNSKYSAQLSTYQIGNFFDNLKFLTMDLFHIREYLVDTKTSKDCAPCDYGIVLGDFVNRKIYSWQGYTRVHNFQLAELALGLSSKSFSNSDNYDSVLSRFKMLYDAGHITKCKRVDYNGGNFATTLMQLDTTRSHLLAIDALLKFKDSHVNVMVDSDFEIVRYTESYKGILQMYQDLLQAGFQFSKADDKHWKEFIARRKEADEEDDEEDESSPYQEY